jgi:hypothetical protein
MATYAQGSVDRDDLGAGVLSVNLEPPELPVLQHTEMTYLDRFPSYISFFAQHPATSGGRSAVGDNMAVTRALLPGGSHSSLGDKLRRHGVSYCRHLSCAASQNTNADRPICRSWQDVFGTGCKRQAERQANGAEHSDLQWLDCGGALWCSTRSAFARDRTKTSSGSSHSNSAAFMCQLHAMHLAGNSLVGTQHSSHLPELAKAGLLPYHTRWGDGSEFSAPEVAAFQELHEPSEEFDLAAGDMVVLNNFRWSHGRTAYDSADDREVWVVMSDPVSRAHVNV